VLNVRDAEAGSAKSAQVLEQVGLGHRNQNLVICQEDKSNGGDRPMHN